MQLMTRDSTKNFSLVFEAGLEHHHIVWLLQRCMVHACVASSLPPNERERSL